MSKDFSIALLCDYYGELLTEKQRQAIELYYNDDLSLAEMADQLSISRQGAHDNIQRGIEKLQEYEQALHMAHKAMLLKDKLTLLKETVMHLSLHEKDKEMLLHQIEVLEEI